MEQSLKPRAQLPTPPFHLEKSNNHTSHDSSFSVQWHKTAIMILTSQGVSIMGTAIVQYAIIWHLTLSTKSGSIMALAAICGLLPTALLSPIGGVWADRYNRRYLVMGADISVALATIIIIVSLMLGNDSLVIILVVLGVRGAASAFQSPAAFALVPSFVPKDALVRYNGLFGMLHALSSTIGPILGGLALSSLPLFQVLFIDVITAVIGVGIFGFFVKVPAYGPGTEAVDKWHIEILKAFRYVRHHEFLLPFFAHLSISMLAFSPPAFLSGVFIARYFGEEPWRLAVMESLFGIGGVIGGILVAAWAGFKREMLTLSVASFLLGILTVAIGIPLNFWYFSIMTGFTGIILPYLSAPMAGIVQHFSDPAYLGRVISLFVIIQNVSLPLGSLVFGPLSDVFPVWSTMVIAGLIQVGVSLAMLSNKRLSKIPPINPRSSAHLKTDKEYQSNR